eukprot:CAMPEP_0168354984 /NCGR_PEP_ID=MMETSP0213-20121227/24249_1 /TAXON_ID=151035 /ORGANISM="Euplotes harpa, Strain FSP1.4" /LENGTH=173 /DNA_ID=CAMNT_0008367045 /DNA_START=71 /DNA_END=593 /DNA_ORIENTATION=-
MRISNLGNEWVLQHEDLFGYEPFTPGLFMQSITPNCKEYKDLENIKSGLDLPNTISEVKPEADAFNFENKLIPSNLKHKNITVPSTFEVDFSCVKHKLEEASSKAELTSQIRASPTETKRTGHKLKTTEYGYLLERKAFRMMKKYYKDKFGCLIDQKYNSIPLMSPGQLNRLV